jgi:hypothetical protein
MALKPSIITYDGLPISSGGAHAMSGRSPPMGLHQIRNFLSHCADAPILTHSSVEVVRGECFPVGFSLPLIARLTAELGNSSLQHVGAKNVLHRWTIGAGQIDDYVALLQQASPLPADPFGLRPFVVGLGYSFRLVEPTTGVVLPGQDPEMYGRFSPSPGCCLGNSQLYTRISDRSSLCLFLSFPFDDQAEAFHGLASHVQTQLPVRLSPRHWKQWRLTKAGSSYVGRRIALRLPG